MCNDTKRSEQVDLLIGPYECPFTRCFLQFITELKYNIETLSGSSVQVTIDSISAGSVKVGSTVLFLSGDSTSSSTYQSALTSGNTANIFGTSFGDVAVDTQSVTTTTVANPSKFATVLHNSLDMRH